MGQRGVAPSRSNSHTGKFESMPPSTIRCSSPVSAFLWITGSKKIGIDMLIRTAYAISISSGSIPRCPASFGSTSMRRWVTSEAITRSR